jgi:alkylation response protein AidB-like acyl-CoA dehydrogenase
MSHLKDFRGIEGTDFFEQDKGLRVVLKDLLSDDEQAQIFPMLHECAKRVAGRWNDLASEANRHENLPKIVKFDRVGNPVERVDFGEYTRQLRREVAEFVLFTKAQSNLHKFAMIYYSAHNGEASLNCGVSCTDGLIRAIEAKGSEFLRDFYLPKLLSSVTPFAGAQFVTERTGGSDVGATETYATPNTDGSWSITGDKWFCSNPDEYYLVAAKVDRQAKGTTGVAVFVVPRVLPDGQLNAIAFERLKDKLGTRSLPTAEMKFEGATGYAIGDTREGFKTLMNYIINVSRIHNAINACAFSHRAFLEARNYARQREAFGVTLADAPLIQNTLLTLLERNWRNRVLTFKLIALVDQNGLTPDDPNQAMWQRFLTNLAKYRTALTLVDSMREAMLILGGNGIVEDFTILPTLFRDAMIIETWEGPPNTLCLQIIRDAARSDLFERFGAEMRNHLEIWPADFLAPTRNRFEQQLGQLTQLLATNGASPRWLEANGRRMVDAMGSLIEIAWLADLAFRQREQDATSAIMTSIAGWQLFDSRDCNHPAAQIISNYGRDLVEEKKIQVELGNL